MKQLDIYQEQVIVKPRFKRQRPTLPLVLVFGNETWQWRTTRQTFNCQPGQHASNCKGKSILFHQKLTSMALYGCFCWGILSANQTIMMISYIIYITWTLTWSF